MREPSRLIDIALIVWFSLTALSVAYVAWDAFTRTPEFRVMRYGWLLVTAYTGPVGAAVYVLACQEPVPGTHERFITPLWKQSVGSTIHCLAGDATGVIVAAAVTALLALPMAIDAVVEYVFGFAFGLFVFQALFMRAMLGGSYLTALRRSFLPEWVSMNAVMAGMIPVMFALMPRDMRAMEPTSIRFWGVMSLASLAGFILAYPVNVWLVAARLKHGMGTDRALGRAGVPVMETPAGAVPAIPVPGIGAHEGIRENPAAAASAAAGLTSAAPAAPVAPPAAASSGATARMPGMTMQPAGGGTTAMGGVPVRATPAQITAVVVLTLVALGAGALIAALASRAAGATMREGNPMRTPMRIQAYRPCASPGAAHMVTFTLCKAGDAPDRAPPPGV